MNDLATSNVHHFHMARSARRTLHKDTEMFNRAMYHKILNEISMLKIIANQIVADDRASDVLSKVIERIEATSEKISQRRDEEKAKLEQVSHYKKIVAIISQTAHDIADIVNNELAIIKRRIQRFLKCLTQKDRFCQKLEQLLKRIEITETALNDLKSINEGINLHYDSFKVNKLFENWQTMPKIQHATLSFDIQNSESKFIGDKEKIKSFLSELVENSLKHNPDKQGLKICISSKDMIGIAPQYRSGSTKKIQGEKKHLFIYYRDNGKGIPPDKKEWIFLPLETTSKEKEGSGLGLFIIKRTLKEMNGHFIEMGTQGARFEIDIPYGEH